MKENSLMYFVSPYELKKFYSKMRLYDGWRIRKGIMNDRGKLIEHKSYTIYLREIFRDKGFFRKDVSLAEIISWLDNMSIIIRLLDTLQKSLSHEQYNNIEICIEYMIDMSKRMRVDYILIFKNNILLIEMRMLSEFSKIRSTWEKKFRELLIYKELMGYYIKNKNLLLYSFIFLYEYNENIVVEKQFDHNNKQVEYLAEFINRYLVY